MPTVSGTVYDDTGLPVGGRIVRAYRRDTGELLAATVSNANGTYVVDVGVYENEVYVICLDDTAGTVYNDLIHRTFPFDSTLSYILTESNDYLAAETGELLEID